MICKLCGEDKDSADFYPRNRVCKPCVLIKLHQWRKRNPEKLRKYARKQRRVRGANWYRDWYASNRERAKVYVKRHVERRRNQFLDWKAKQRCLRCGEDHPACLEFHHRDPAQKSFDISQGWRLNYAWDRMVKELAKCDVLCANCHRKLHWENGHENLKIQREFSNRPSYRKPRI